MIRTGAGPATGVLRPERSPSGAVSVLIIVADGVLAGPLATAFDAAGALTIVARDPATARIRFNADRPDVVVLDLQLGAWSGFDILRELRAAGDVPIVVLTARDSDDDRTRALGMGADDYVSKPFDDRELVARALGRLRQPGAVTAPAMVPHIVAGGLELDATTHTVTRDGRPLNLTVTEFKLLHHLMANAGRVVETGSLLRDVWEQGDRKDPDVLRVTLHRLRKKLGEPAHSEIIQTVPGVGILFKTAADATLTKSEPWSPEPRQPVPERVAIGPIEFADRDRLRLRGVSDPQLESLLFAIPAAALEAFESDRFASTWIVPFAAAGTFDAIEAARSAGHAVAADVSERLAGSRPKVVVTRRQYGATLVGSPSPATRPEDALAPTAADAILESPVRPAAVAQLPAAMPTSAVTPTPAPRAASQPATAQAPAAVPVMATPAASAMETAPSADRVRGRETPLPTVAVAARALAAATSARAAGAVRGGSTRAAGLAAGLRTSTQLGRSRVRLPSRPLPLRQSPAAVPTDIPAKAREQHADTAAPSHRRLSTPARSIAVLLFVCMAVALLSVAFQPHRPR
ncbi:MAG TPA: winged helix-turn-helix domain-containing protein [Candidatus Limnocylindria bacterium]